MKVLFDAFWWERGPGANRTVQKELIAAWRRLFPDDELVLALRRGADAPDTTDIGLIVNTRLWPHAAANRWDLPRIARQVGADVIVAHNYAPRSGASVVFIHDAMFVDHPEWFSLSEKAYFSLMIPWARAADAIATSTLTEAHRIDRLMKRRVGSTSVTGLGVPSGLTSEAPRRPTQVAADTSFALTVGRLNIRKNLLAVMRGAGVADSISPTSPLIVVGGTAHSGRATDFPDDVSEAIRDGRVILLGSATDSEVAWLYAHASLVISLSLDEGFGLPALEAAAFGAPLLVSDIAVFRETVGDYAAFVSPTAPTEEVARAIDGEWGHRPAAETRSSVVSRYSWDGAAAALRVAASSLAPR
ncbi:glycosyltransferase family 1 protein [Microbacterium sp. 1P10UB]|uniref:glycosyltransferase family 4 protein n=1 Tax=unclassified Microbacterium TaxID=2609290 RepID=UPI0039A1A01F